MKVIYDIGANNGDNLPYYLMKADRVVAVEANPDLAESIRKRFEAEIAAGRVIVENCVATAGEEGQTVPFYIHPFYQVQSQFTPPADERRSEFICVDLPAKRLVSVIGRHGAPFYVKIDVEGYDQELLRDLFDHGIHPPYLSVESHSIEVFARLVACGRYQAFKLVDGWTVSEVYGRHTVDTNLGPVDYSFPDHSAGPFGNDIPGAWQTPDDFFQTLAQAGLGWRDIHVSAVDPPQAATP